MITQYLEDLENRIEPQVEDTLIQEWQTFIMGDYDNGLFSPSRDSSFPPNVQWPKFTINQALDDLDHMLISQLRMCSESLEKGNGNIMTVRSNYGTGILSSLFNADIFRMDDETDTLPTTVPLEGGIETIEKIIEQGPPDIHQAFGEAALRTGRYYKQVFEDYPKIEKYVFIYHPDLQGPMDICELLWGSPLFTDIIDHPEAVKSLLEIITETYIEFMDEWNTIIPPHKEWSAHWGMLQRGTVMLRDDSAMNFSPDMFKEFIEPYDTRILDTYGGGAIHFCGRGDHYIDRFPEMGGVYCANMSQPDYNDMEKIFSSTVDKNIQLLALDRETAQNALVSGRALHGNVHCF